MNPPPPRFQDTFPAPLGDLAIALPPLASTARPPGLAKLTVAGRPAQTDQAALLSRLI